MPSLLCLPIRVSDERQALHAASVRLLHKVHAQLLKSLARRVHGRHRKPDVTCASYILSDWLCEILVLLFRQTVKRCIELL